MIRCAAYDLSALSPDHDNDSRQGGPPLETVCAPARSSSITATTPSWGASRIPTLVGALSRSRAALGCLRMGGSVA